MFRASPDSSQIDLFSNVEQFLRARDQEKLNDPNAWHNVFLDQVTKRIPEKRFSELFDEGNGRPNAPTRLLVAMLILKEGFGRSDEQLFEAIHFNLLVRRALGLLNLTGEVPVESTYYLFKQRLYRYQLEVRINLLHEVFQELTRDQAKRFGVVGEKLRMDSTLLDSNLATCTRLQLIIGCLQAFWKSLTDGQQAGQEAHRRAICVLPVSLHELPPPGRYRGSPVLGDPEAPRCHCHPPQPRPIWRRRPPPLPAGAMPQLWARAFPKHSGRGRLSWPVPMGWPGSPRRCGWTTPV